MNDEVKETCASCSKELTDDNKCMCDPTICAKCCKCADDCTCGCKEKADNEEVSE